MVAKYGKNFINIRKILLLMNFYKFIKRSISLIFMESLIHISNSVRFTDDVKIVFITPEMLILYAVEC